MKSKRIISSFLCVVILFSLISLPVHADYVNTPQTLWDLTLHRLSNGFSILGLQGGFNGVVGQLSGAICETTSDGYHHADSLTGCELGSDRHGQYAIATCKYCGKHFNCYSSDLKQAYEDQVTTLPATGIDSSNGLIYTVPFTYMRIGNLLSDASSYMSFGADPAPGTWTLDKMASYWGGPVTLSGSSSKLDLAIDTTKTKLYLKYGFYLDAKAPVMGTYTPIQKTFERLYGNSDGYNKSTGSLWQDQSIKPYSKVANSNLPSPDSFSVVYSGTSYQYYSRILVSMPTVSFQVIPDDTSIVEGDTYNINSRPATIIGDYGIIGDNGQIIKVDSNTIINETNKTVYNPVTNTTNNFTDWQYDYSTRTYNITLDSGNTQTITYGDENVTITEIDNSSGDTITNNYTIYYVVEAPSTCAHSWTETSNTAATCTVPGSRVLTCSLCNETKTESIPAPGHTWEIKETVDTEYDEAGQVTQQGYTLYECSVCGEQYKSEDGTAPPSGGTDTDPGGFWNWWKTAWNEFTVKLFGFLSPGPGGGGPGSETIPDETLPPEEGEGEDDGWTVLDLLVVLKDGTWAIVKGTVKVAFGGVVGIVTTVTTIGNFFTAAGDLSNDIQGGYDAWSP